MTSLEEKTIQVFIHCLDSSLPVLDVGLPTQAMSPIASPLDSTYTVFCLPFNFPQDLPKMAAPLPSDS